MLYNPKWSTTPSLDGLIAWLETKDRNEPFCATDPDNCLYGQYYRQLGRKPVIEVEDIAAEIGLPTFKAMGIIIQRTFGEALRQARAYRASL